MEPMISVIIPVYNAEKSINRCIDSVLAQSYVNLQIVVVNDGSKDNSGAICEKAACSDSRIIVIHISNKGVSGARNIGLQSAQGEYIAFIDSDDAVPPDYFMLLYQKIIATGADLQMCAIDSVTETKRQTNFCKPFISGNFLITEESFIDFMNGIVFCSSCAKLFRADIIKSNGVAFPEGFSFGEDLLFNLQYYSHCRKIAYDNSPAYLYTTNGTESLAHLLRQDMFEVEKILSSKLQAFAWQNGLNSERVIGYINERLFDCAYNAICFTRKWKSGGLKDKYRYIRDIVNDPVLDFEFPVKTGYSPNLLSAIKKKKAMILTLYINLFV